MSFWPLPGGWESYLETLSLILSKIRESRPTLDELANWAGNRFGSKPEWTRESLRVCILYTSLARMEGNSLYLTEEGRRFLEAKDGEIVLNCLCRNIWGIREMLLWLMERPMTSRELFEKFKELGARWKKDYQVGYRLLWLRALGVIDEEGGRYSLTDYGIKFVKDLERIERKPPSSIEIYVKSVNEQIGRYPVDFWTEDNTKAVLVEPLMEVLGWNIRDLGEVIRGYGVRVGTKTEYVDYILKIDGRPKIFVEVKALGKDLEPFVDQAISYAKLGDVTWAVLTNGRELRVYDARSRFQLFKLTVCFKEISFGVCRTVHRLLTSIQVIVQ
jgi:hypothetical protein